MLIADSDNRYSRITVNRMFQTFINSEFFRYLVASLAALAADFSGLYILTEFLGFHYLNASAISFLLGMLLIYILSINWVFKHRYFSRKRIELPIFLFIGVIGLAINQAGMYIITEFIGLYYLVSKIVITGVVFSWNFLARKFTLFTKKNDK